VVYFFDSRCRTISEHLHTGFRVDDVIIQHAAATYVCYINVKKWKFLQIVSCDFTVHQACIYLCCIDSVACFII